MDEEELVATELQPMDEPVGTLYLPKQFSFGIGETEKRTLFQNLPILSAEATALGNSPHETSQWLAMRHGEGVQRELQKSNSFAKVLDLRNANAGGISYENRRRIILEFSAVENPFDPGRSEVQGMYMYMTTELMSVNSFITAALLTYKIRNLWTHLIKFKRDVGNRRGLRKLVHQRAKILKYLKRLDRDRYDTLLERLALEPESVEGELVV